MLRHAPTRDLVLPAGNFRQRALRPARRMPVGAAGRADVSVVVEWIMRQPDVDPRRIGVVGVSLGAIITHLTMGRDSRLSAGVAVLGAGDLPDLYRRSILYRLLHPSATRALTPEELIR